MKKILSIVLVLLMLASNAYAVVVPTRVSGNRVTFSTISSLTPSVVTFNSVTKHIIMWNDSPHVDALVDLRCWDSATSKTGLISVTNATVRLPKCDFTTPNFVTLDFATRNLGFICEADGSSPTTQYVNYIVTGERGDF